MVKKNIKTATIKQKYTKHNMVKKNSSNNQTKLHKTQQGKQKKNPTNYYYIRTSGRVCRSCSTNGISVVNHVSIKFNSVCYLGKGDRIVVKT